MWSDPGLRGATTQHHLDTQSHPVDHHGVEDIPHATWSDKQVGFPDVYVNGEDVTVTVDPVKNSMWIVDEAERHNQSTRRGALKDHAGVMAVQHLLDKHTREDVYFCPRSVHLNGLNKWTPRCIANSSRGGNPGNTGNDTERGKLPIISKLIWENRLADKPDWLTEAEMWASRDRDRRMFDCRGPCR